MLTRRTFLRSGVAGLAIPALPGLAPATTPQDALPPLKRPSGSPESVARDEAYWRRVAAYYRVSKDFTNHEARYWGMMAAPVLAAYHRHTGIDVLTPDDAGMAAAITSFRVHGRGGRAENQDVVRELVEKHKSIAAQS